MDASFHYQEFLAKARQAGLSQPIDLGLDFNAIVGYFPTEDQPMMESLLGTALDSGLFERVAKLPLEGWWEISLSGAGVSAVCNEQFIGICIGISLALQLLLPANQD